MKLKNKTLAVAFTAAVFFGVGIKANAYTVETNLIGNGNPTGSYSSSQIIVLHESGNPNNVGANSLDNEVSYMKRNWTSAFVSHWVGSGGRVIQTASTGVYQYGAGSWANARAYAQIELARTNNKNTFIKDYVSYVNLARNLANRAGISTNLDDSSHRGIKSHLWITQNIWGDHTDPYGYLGQWGISKAKIAADLKTGTSVAAVNSYLGGSASANNNSANNSKPASAYKVEAYNIKQTVDVNGLNVRAAQNASSAVVGQLNKGQSFTATRICKNGQGVTVNGVTYYTWFEVNGKGWVSGAYVTPAKAAATPTPAPAPTAIVWKAQTGTFTANTTINVRNAASTSGAIVAQYKAGQSVNYNAYKIDQNGYVWIRYTSFSGAVRYMATGVSKNGVRTSYWGSFR